MLIPHTSVGGNLMSDQK